MKKKKRWLRDEILYKKIQETEFLNFFDLVRFISLKVCKGKKMRNTIVCLLIWHNLPSLSTRRARGLLLLFRKIKLIDVDIPCFKTLSNYRADSSLHGALQDLIGESSKPLAKIEHDFATDSVFSDYYCLTTN